ncbi:MAG: RNA polymerase sigma factor RpoD/SigA [bacterium]|nr:RNA polymerase sigma factor RpoD/SigA [bacterium]
MSRGDDPIEGVFDGNSDLLHIYFRDIENSGGLPAEREQELAKLIKLGDEEALNELIKNNLRFVVDVAKKYINKGLPLSDLIQAGNSGLITAAQRFDGNKGFKFISYAVWWIRQGILQTLAEHARIVRLPLNKIGELDRLNKLEASLVQVLGRIPKIEEILSESELKTKEDIDDLREISQKPISLNYEVNDDGNMTFLDNLIDDDPLPDESIEIKERSHAILVAVRECLNDREYYIIKRYHGLDGAEPQTLEKIGENINLTRERIRQLKERALGKLRSHFARNKLEVLF